MANNKLISYNNLDNDLKKMLMGVSPNTAQIEKLLSNYFNKLSDKVTASLLHPSIEANFHNYSDAEDNKIKVGADALTEAKTYMLYVEATDTKGKIFDEGFDIPVSE